MAKKKKDLSQEILECFIEVGQYKSLSRFVKDAGEVFKLFMIEKDSDWVQEEVGGDQEHVDNVRIARTVYLMSRIADLHSGYLLNIQTKYPGLWKKIVAVSEKEQERINRESLTKNPELGNG